MEITGVRFETLTGAEVYELGRLRQRVFVVEQDCPYEDLDGRDLEPGTWHVLLRSDDDELVGYARVLDDRDTWRIGRVLLDRTARGRGLADDVMMKALSLCEDRDVVLDAQSPLAPWYASFGFDAAGPDFVEDGIPHTPMRLTRR